MNLYPAIDLYDQNAVRLLKGDFKKLTVYDRDPVALAKRFETEGVRRLHVVDLNAAEDGSMVNESIIEAIVDTLDIPIQLGGGIRTLKRAERLISKGVDRIIIGSMAIKDETTLIKLLDRYPERIAVAIDAQAGMVKTDGWAETSEVEVLTFAKRMVELGAKTLIYTDIEKDGTLSGVETSMYKALSALDANVVASGGVASIKDIEALKKLPLEGIITGKAIYEGTLDLKEALACLQNG
ncbi:MAG: 1-(5-phosphoribosyl)-5-[(5-phosphoribosylamino)methylideneamino]imidazole-4-carboxamide isomerase [Candidatus Izemoplasmataceae bacterium]